MSIAKSTARSLGLLLALPHLAAYRLGCLLLGQEKAFRSASERLARKPGLLGLYTRQAFYRQTLDYLGRDVYFGFMSVLSKPAARIADHVYIGRFCTLGWVDLGQGVMLADGVQVLSGRHQHGSASVGPGHALRDNPHSYQKITIGAGAWLGAASVVMADVGQRAVVGAGAVVVQPVPSAAKVGGVPARPLPSAPLAKAG